MSRLNLQLAMLRAARRRRNPAYGLFCNLVMTSASVQYPPGSPQSGLPVTTVCVVRPQPGNSLSGFFWGFPPFANTLSLNVDETGLVTVNAGAPTGTNDRATGTFQVPVGRYSQLVFAVRPADGKIRVWRNGDLVLRAESPNGVLRDGSWGFIQAPGSTFGDPSSLVGRRVCFMFNQLPRVFT